MEKKQNRKNVQFLVQMTILLILTGLLIFSLNNNSYVKSNEGPSIKSIYTSKILPSGVPLIYGSELGISYDDVSPDNSQKTDETIRLLGNIDRKEILEGENLKRYVNILYNLNNGISCEFCCGARSVISKDGGLACGCAHSYAIRGLTKYLIKFHGNEFTDEEILSEVGKWKVLFFPGIHEGKSKVLVEQGIELNYINLASNKYRGIEKGKVNGGMVGGC